MAITKSTAFPIRCPALDTRRLDLTERMEEPGIPKDRFHRTLEQFTVVNRLFSRYRSVLKRWVISDMERAPSRRYTLLDIGAGACDIDHWLSAHANRRRLQLRILAVDHDPRVAAYCRNGQPRIPGHQGPPGGLRRGPRARAGRLCLCEPPSASPERRPGHLIPPDAG